MQIGVPKEILAGETRVAASPSSVEQLIKLGFEVVIESQAGSLASFEDAAYQAAGATMASKDDVWQSDIVLKVNAPVSNEEVDEISLLKEGATLN
ncbi:NAD(P) transhydrogenase subunit alpha [Vibrio furnissii NCTC 11218]|nr:NAD(P) transhydrogenase subunit alpha [Vibrio furnissii NCTC 11218]